MKRIAAVAATAVGILALALFMGGAVASGHGGGPNNKDAANAQPASDQGVKPSNDTQKDTHAQAGSNQTKLYGNGKTAGQIAIANGAGPTTDLHGPGNSQPHKVAGCRGHEVDVHALKSHLGDSCTNTAKTNAAKVEGSQETAVKANEATHAKVTLCHATGSSTNPFVQITISVNGAFHGHLGHQDRRDIIPPFQYKGQTYSLNWDTNGQAMFNNGCKSPAAAAQSASTTSATNIASTNTSSSTNATANTTSPSATTGVLGATHTVAPAKHHRAAVPVKSAAKSTPKAKSGVLGALHPLTPASKNSNTGTLGTSSAKLPFTGLPLWPALAAAFGLLLAGGGMRLASRRV